MIIRTRSMLLTERMREVIPANAPDFPYTAQLSDVSAYSGRYSPWHWHEHFEFAMVSRGSIEFRTNRLSAVLSTGDAYFTNASALHLCKAVDGEEWVQLQVQQFTRSLIAGTGLIARRYVMPIENAAALEAVVLRRNREPDRQIIAALNRAFSAAEREEAGFEMEIALHLQDAWRQMYRMISPTLQEGEDGSREYAARAKAMLSFIHENYGHPITVQQIAEAAGVCERECFRCFARMMDTTPKAYLAKYRIAMACRMLSETDEPITHIAYRCGFTSSSYFGSVFHQMTGCSPREFRQR